MKVLHVNFSDQGGAGIAARRGHLALLASGLNSKMLVAKKTTNYPEIYELNNPLLRRLWRFIQLKYEQILKRNIYKGDRGIRCSNHLPGFISNEIRRFNPDIVHLHWINAGMMSIEEIQRINVPVVWTLHDLWPINGCCHCAGSMMDEVMAGYYPSHFEDIDDSGYSKKIGSRYRNSLKCKPDGIVVLCRKFQLAVVNASWLPNKNLVRIPNCLDFLIFYPVKSKVPHRRQFGLPEDKVLLLFGAATLHARHKGMDLLMGALEILDRKLAEKCCLVVVGGEAGVSEVGGMKCLSLGSISTEEDMAKIYQACDVFLCPSREDNFPNTVAEASSCGLPTVAFDTGGLADMIDHLKTGYLAQPFSIDSYSKGVALTIEQRNTWSMAAAKKAQSIYDPSQYCSMMVDFYREVIDNRSS
jgi:glycosyltransferase involved in cell wall biosynthesis